MRRRRRARIRRLAKWTAAVLVAVIMVAVLLLVSDGADGEPQGTEQRYYISDDYYYTNYEDYLQAVKERDAAHAAEEEAARQEAEEIRRSIDEYNARVQAQAEAEFKEMQEQYRTEIPDKYDDIPLLQEVVRTLRHGGAKVNDSCGIHVHIGLGSHTAQTLRNLVNIMAAKEDLLA